MAWYATYCIFIQYALDLPHSVTVTFSTTFSRESLYTLFRSKWIPMHLVTFHEVMGLRSSVNTGTASYRQMLSQVILELFWSQICWELPVADKVPSILAIQGCRFVPQNMFGNDPPQMVTLVPNNLNISFQGPWRLDSGSKSTSLYLCQGVFFVLFWSYLPSENL